MIDEENVAKINQGAKHIVLLSDGQFGIECRHCGTKYSLAKHIPIGETGLPIWVMLGLCWGFANEHAECEAPE